MITENIGEIAALGTAFCWTFSAIFFEHSGKRVGSLSVNYIRLIAAFIFISIFTFFTRGLFLPTDASSNNWIFLSISGFIGFFIGDLFLFQSYLEVGSRISMLIMAGSPPITAILGYLVFGEQLSLLSLIGMVITLIGIGVVILGRDSNEEKFRINYSKKGIIYALLGSLGQAVGLIFSKVGMEGYNIFASTQIRIITGLISFSIFIF